MSEQTGDLKTVISSVEKEDGASSQPRLKLGTFGGVFSPTVLTILGVIMYLRLGWVVGNAGLLGAIVIILLAKSVTICTGLSMASITTNIKIGAGGAYSIIAKSLGLETGGSVGIPFYISQTLSTALYIIGFTEGWLGFFPDHPAVLVALTTWLVVMITAGISTTFAIRTQYIIMLLIALSIISFLLTKNPPLPETPLIGNFEDAGFWQVFAVFFPAVTGIMAGANMSGDLKDPRRSIPVGTLSAIGITMIIYIGLAYMLATHFTPEELRTNQMVMADGALFRPLVLIGILAATFSSALGSIMGAPRILQALSEHKIVPMSSFFVKKTDKGEPRNAAIFTGLIVLVAILPGNLNTLATLITMFFLITYGMLNLVVFIQQSMKIISFRPTFRIPRFVSLFGAIGCVFMMFLINPIFSAVAIVIIILIYIWLTRKELDPEFGDLRGGMFLALAERASRVAARFPRHQISWKPDLLLPIDDPRVWSGSLMFIRDITYPSGSIFAFTVSPDKREEKLQALHQLLEPLRDQDIFVNAAVIEDDNFVHGARVVMQTLQGGAFRPNLLFLTLGNDSAKDSDTATLIQEAYEDKVGILLLRQHPRVAFGMQKDINLWLRERSTNWHLAILITLYLRNNWGGRLNLITTAKTEADRKRMYNFLELLSNTARLPSMTEFVVVKGDLDATIKAAPRADINVMGIGEKPDFEFMRKIVEKSNASCLFVKDSGNENALV